MHSFAGIIESSNFARKSMPIMEVATAKCGPAAGLLVFLVGAALLALVGLVAEAGVVESQAVAAAALGRPGGGRAAAALVAAGRLAAERGGGSARVPEGRLHVRDSRGGGGSGLLRGLRHPVPEFIEPVLGLKTSVFVKISLKCSFSIQTLLRDAISSLFLRDKRYGSFLKTATA
jgi:hypothetical protein